MNVQKGFAQAIRDIWLAGYSRKECHDGFDQNRIPNMQYWHEIIDNIYDDLEFQNLTYIRHIGGL